MFSQLEGKRYPVGTILLPLFLLVCIVPVTAELRSSQVTEKPSKVMVRQRIEVLMDNLLKEREKISPDGRKLWVPVPPPQEVLQEMKGYGDQVVPILTEYLRSGTYHERELAMQFLGELGGDRTVQPLLRVLRNDPEPKLREDALTYIKQLPWEVAFPILRETSETNSNPRVREEAKYVLDRHEAAEVKSPSEGFIRRRIKVMMDDILKKAEVATSEGVKLHTVARPTNEDIEEIKHYGDAAVPILAEYLTPEENRQKSLAIRFLGILGGSRIVGPLEGVIRHDPSPGLREAALRWLAETPQEMALPIIEEAAQNDPDQNVRQTARDILNTWNPKQM